MFHQGQLTRGTGIDPRSLTFAVLDFETTGLHPEDGARVCEIGIVRMRGDGEVLDEYSTLIDPEVSITNDEHHGITDADVAGAPTFAEVAGDVLAFLSDAIVVSHNLEYEEKFLTAEFGRLGITVAEPLPALCTLVLSRTQLDHYVYRLANLVYLITGEWPRDAHSALGDTRALARLLTALLTEAPQPLRWHGPAPAPLPAQARSGVIAPRASALRKGTEGWLVNLTARLPRMAAPPAPRPEGLGEYRARLSHALTDGRIVGEEAEQLAVLAARAGLTQTTARQVHEEFLAEARTRAEADGTITAAKLKELRRAARELDATHVISDLEEAAAAEDARRNGPLKGWRLVPVGDSEEITAVVDFAYARGATVGVNVTKTVRLVVTDDVDGDDRKLAQAREAEIIVATPEQARKILDKEIVGSDTGLFADPDGEQLAEQLTAEREAATQPDRSEWHEYWRPRELTPAEYQAEFVDRFKDREASEIVIRMSDEADSQKGPRKAAKGGCVVVAVMSSGILVGAAELVRQIVG